MYKCPRRGLDNLGNLPFSSAVLFHSLPLYGADLVDSWDDVYNMKPSTLFRRSILNLLSDCLGGQTIWKINGEWLKPCQTSIHYRTKFLSHDATLTYAHQHELHSITECILRHQKCKEESCPFLSDVTKVSSFGSAWFWAFQADPLWSPHRFASSTNDLKDCYGKGNGFGGAEALVAGFFLWPLSFKGPSAFRFLASPTNLLTYEMYPSTSNFLLQPA